MRWTASELSFAAPCDASHSTREEWPQETKTASPEGEHDAKLGGRPQTTGSSVAAVTAAVGQASQVESPPAAAQPHPPVEHAAHEVRVAEGATVEEATDTPEPPVVVSAPVELPATAVTTAEPAAVVIERTPVEPAAAEQTAPQVPVVDVPAADPAPAAALVTYRVTRSAAALMAALFGS